MVKQFLRAVTLAAAFIFAVCSTSAASDEDFFQRVCNGDIEGVQKAIAAGQDVNVRNGQGETPLSSALQRGSLGVVETLLAAGADVNARNKSGETPLNNRYVLLMINNPRNNSEEKLRIIRKLLDAGANPNIPADDGTTPLMRASLMAVQAPDENVFRLVKMLLEVGADVSLKDVNEMTALHWWIDSGKAEVIRLLLEAGTNPNDADKEGMTPLMWAVVMHPRNGTVPEALIEGGADVNAKTKEDSTALSMAAALGKTEPVAILLKAGASAKTDAGALTPLHLATGLIAMERGDLTGSFEERAKKAVGNLVFNQVHSPFSPDFLGVTKLLIEAGAEIDARCAKIPDEWMFFLGNDREASKRFEGKNSLEFARILGSEAVARYLESFADQF
jgi:ankyrin repeat protein